MARLADKLIARHIAARLLKGANSTGISRSVAGLLVSQRRTRDLPALMRLVEQELARQGRAQVSIRSARPLSDQHKQQLALLLGVSSPLIHESIDTNLLGGAIAETADKRVDLSVRGKLEGLRTSVKKGTN